MNGPQLTVLTSCSECDYLKCVSYACQGDSGFNHYCTFPNIMENKFDNKVEGCKSIGMSCKPPNWCPLLEQAYRRLINQLEDKS